MKSVFDRRMKIMIKLNHCRRVKRIELASEFDVSDDTIGRDLDAIGKYMPLRSKSGRNGCVYIMKEYIPMQYLTFEEIMLLQHLITTVSAADGIILGGVLRKYCKPEEKCLYDPE